MRGYGRTCQSADVELLIENAILVLGLELRKSACRRSEFAPAAKCPYMQECLTRCYILNFDSFSLFLNFGAREETILEEIFTTHLRISNFYFDLIIYLVPIDLYTLIMEF